MVHFRARAPKAEAAGRLYDAAVERSRSPAFYRELQVPDTIDGRFDLLVLHAFLVMKHLKAAALPTLSLFLVRRSSKASLTEWFQAEYRRRAADS